MLITEIMEQYVLSSCTIIGMQNGSAPLNNYLALEIICGCFWKWYKICYHHGRTGSHQRNIGGSAGLSLPFSGGKTLPGGRYDMNSLA